MHAEIALDLHEGSSKMQPENANRCGAVQRAPVRLWFRSSSPFQPREGAQLRENNTARGGLNGTVARKVRNCG